MQSVGFRAQELSSCGAQAQLPRGMWNLPGPGINPVSAALAGRLPTTGPPGKSGAHILTGVTSKSVIGIISEWDECSVNNSTFLYSI